MKQLLVPAHYPPTRQEEDEYFEQLDGLNERFAGSGRVEEVYGSFPFHALSGGRRDSSVSQTTQADAKRFVRRLQEQSKVDFRYVLNSSCLGAWEYDASAGRHLFDVLTDLVEEYGIRKIVICNTNLIDVVVARFPKLEVSVSTINELDTVRSIKRFAELGIKRTVISKSRHRDLQFHKDVLAQTEDLEVEIMLNQGCPIATPFCRDHYNFLAHIGKTEADEPDIYFSRCLVEKYENPVQWLKTSIIRPEDYDRYLEDQPERIFGKIVGRERSRRALETAETYLRGDFDGNLLELIGNFAPKSDETAYWLDNKKLDGFFDFFAEGKCDWNCSSCSWCDTYAKRALSVPDQERLSERLEQHKKSLDVLKHIPFDSD